MSWATSCGWGDAARIRANSVRQQKTDKRDAEHILKLPVEGRFPRIWMRSLEVRDLQLLPLHHYKLGIIRARVKNELQHLGWAVSHPVSDGMFP